MSAHISAHGRLARDPAERQTKTGKTMVLASIAVDVTANNSEEQETLWLSLMAFGAAAETLARCKAGESVSVIGRLTKNRYVTKTGEERESWTCVVDAVLTTRSARPGGGRKSGASAQNWNNAPGATTGAEADRPKNAPRHDFDDDIPF